MLVYYVYHMSETAVVWGLRELIPVMEIGIVLMQIDRLAFDYLKYIHMSCQPIVMSSW